MEDQDDVLYLGVGPLAAILIGMSLVPFRDFTIASNFTFVFMALTIVVAEFGGRRAAVATALTSALSLDFFLTKPYLQLTIEGKHDIIAFCGLAACGLVAAALGSQRSERVAALRAARTHLELLHLTLRQLEAAGPVEPALGRILNAVQTTLPLAAAVVRDERNHVVAASDQAYARRVPDCTLLGETLLPPEATRDLIGASVPFPGDGSRLALVAGNRQVGWLDVWGNGSPATADARYVLADVGRLIGFRLTGRAGVSPG